MNNKKQKLELTWIGKDEQPVLEPRILIEDPEKSYGDKNSENMLIYGDNLLALKALEQDFAGKIKCIYIDPPFNTGAAFEYYDDNLEHSIWLNLMYSRLKILNKLLSKSGFIIVHLDDTEVAYCKIILDEIFGRDNYLNTVCVSANSPFGFKHTSKSIFKTTNYLIIYAKDLESSKIKVLFKSRGYDKAYKYILLNKNDNYDKWQWKLLNQFAAEKLGYKDSKSAKKTLGIDLYEKEISTLAIENSESVFRTASVTGGAYLKRKNTLDRSKLERNKIITHPNDDMKYYFLNGERIIFYDERMQIIEGKKSPGEVLTDMWADISWEGIAKEGGVDFPKGKKPEKLIKRCIELCTDENDWVLDSFLGSGTTASVAHKMNRKWIGIELGEHCHTHCIPRLKSVIDGNDKGGITESVKWDKGGGFKYFNLSKSLLNKDEFGNWVISKEYNSQMLAAAMAKNEGFKYDPDENLYWKQGQSSEKDFIFTTTGFITVGQLDLIHEQMKEDESLLICCKSFSKESENRYSNITIKKIPQMLLGRCEFGKEDYSLNIINVPTLNEETDATKNNIEDSTTEVAQEGLFEGGDDE